VAALAAVDGQGVADHAAAVGAEVDRVHVRVGVRLAPGEVGAGALAVVDHAAGGAERAVLEDGDRAHCAADVVNQQRVALLDRSDPAGQHFGPKNHRRISAARWPAVLAA
jgi:hypothetical protein